MTLRALVDHQLVPGRDLQLVHFNSHGACIQQVWAGAASACGTARPLIQIFAQRMQARLRAIHDTPAVPHVMAVVHALLQNLGFPGFVGARPAAYEVLACLAR